MIRPRFYFWLTFVFLLWLGTHLGDWNWANLLLIFLLLLPLFSLLSAFLLRQRIRLEAGGQMNYIERGRVARWIYSLKTPRSMGAFVLLTQFREKNGESESSEMVLRGGEQFDMAIEMIGRHTGMLRPADMQLRILDSFAFFSLKIGDLDEQSFPQIAVLPRSLTDVSEKDESRRVLDSADQISRKSETQTDEIDRMRQMQPGDRIRSIHWKLSARMQQWMVRQYEKADEAQIHYLMHLPSADGSNDEINEQALYIRDAVLDRVSATAQNFLNNRYTICLQTRMPWLEKLEIKNMDEYSLLRIRLAELPYRRETSFEEQLFEESEQDGKRFYCLFSYELSQTICDEILLLALRAQGVMIQLVSPSRRVPPEWRGLIELLAHHGIKVYLSRQPKGVK